MFCAARVSEQRGDEPCFPEEFQVMSELVAGVGVLWAFQEVMVDCFVLLWAVWAFGCF